MKRISLSSIIILASSIGIFAQKPAITLTFTAAKANTSEFVQLDSIRITNVSQSVDTILHFPDTILVLDYTTGINGNKKQNEGFRVIRNRPNPAIDQTIVSIFVPSKDNVTISVTDVRGRSLLRSELLLDRGYHSFSFRPEKRGVFFLTATWRKNNSTIKILSEVKVNQKSELVYTGVQGTGLILKSNGVAMGFEFNPGDSLLYIGYANTPEEINGSDVLSDRPQSEETYLFEIIEGIPCPGIPAVNYGGQTYATVQIVDQCWFKENLNVGTRIIASQQQTNNFTIEKYCYNNNESNCDVYGGIYQWNEAMQYIVTPGVQGICPTDWHIPTDDEWTTLTTSLGGENIAGGKMKETGTVHWASPNTGATNSSGFTALPGGYSAPAGLFAEITKSGSFWESAQDGNIYAWCRYIYWNHPNLFKDPYHRSYGWSVRCLKN